jgi:hypothetical protein
MTPHGQAELGPVVLALLVAPALGFIAYVLLLDPAPVSSRTSNRAAVRDLPYFLPGLGLSLGVLAVLGVSPGALAEAPLLMGSLFFLLAVALGWAAGRLYHGRLEAPLRATCLALLTVLGAMVWIPWLEPGLENRPPAGWLR